MTRKQKKQNDTVVVLISITAAPPGTESVQNDTVQSSR